MEHTGHGIGKSNPGGGSSGGGNGAKTDAGGGSEMLPIVAGHEEYTFPALLPTCDCPVLGDCPVLVLAELVETLRRVGLVEARLTGP